MKESSCLARAYIYQFEGRHCVKQACVRVAYSFIMIYTVISVKDVGSLSVSIAKMLGPTVL